MFRVIRLSLAQTLLLVALAAFTLAIATEMWRHHLGVTANTPSLAISPDGKSLAMNVSFRPLFQRRHPVVVQDLQHPKSSSRKFEAHSWVVSDVDWSADGREIISSSGDHTIRFWDVASGQQIKQINTKSHVPGCLAISTNGRLIATGGSPIVEIWDVDTKRSVASLTGHKRWTWAAAFSPDGKYLVTGCIDAEIKIWDAATWKLIRSLKLNTATRHLSFTPTGRLITGGLQREGETDPWQSCVSVYDIPSSEMIEHFSITKTWAAVSSLAVSPNGRLLAAAHGGDPKAAHNAVTVWDMVSKQKLKTLEIDDHGENWIEALAFSVDGEVLYCGSTDGKVTAQAWRRGESKVVFARRGFPWMWALVFGFLWLAAWWYSLRHAPTRRIAAANRAVVEPMRCGI